MRVWGITVYETNTPFHHRLAEQMAFKPID
jgi:hypothetical protein